MPSRQFTADEVDGFYLAAGRGDLATVRRLLDAGLDVDSATQREFHRTALMGVAMTDRVEPAQLLVARGAALDVRDRELGCTAVILAAQQRSTAVLRLLAEAGARLNVFNSAGYSALFWCVENGDADSVDVLLDCGADADRRSRDGLAALHLCCAFGRVGIARRLLEAGAEVDPVSCALHGRHTPLTIAAAAGNVELLALLVEHGADLEHSAEEGTAMALARGRRDIAACVDSLIRSAQLKAQRRRSSAAAVTSERASARARQARRAAAAVTASRPGGRPRSALPTNVYSTSARPRGVCLVVSNSRFAHELDYPALPGSEERTAVLTEAFSDLGFRIRPAAGLSGADLLARVQRLAAADHSAADLLVCAFLTYGVGGCVVGSDGKSVDIGQLVDCFRPANCPGLAGKPKIFLCLLATAPRPRFPGPACPEPGQPDCLVAYAVVGGGGGANGGSGGGGANGGRGSKGGSGGGGANGVIVIGGADGGSGGDTRALTTFLLQMRRALNTESEHVDFGSLLLAVGERVGGEESRQLQQLVVEVQHSLDKQLVFR